MARHAGVSTATVTRVLNGSGPVAHETRERVLHAVEELHYVPNAVARHFFQKRTRLLGLIIPDITNSYFAQLSRGVEDRAAAAAHHVIIGSSDLTVEREQSYVSVFLSRVVDGVIVTPSGRGGSDLARFLELGIPMVYADRAQPGVPAPIVKVDNIRAAREGVEHLLDLGHDRIAIITGPLEFGTAAERLDGFLAAYRSRGLEPIGDLTRHGYMRASGGYAAMTDLFELDDPPTAVMCFNSLVALGAIEAAVERGRHLPDDLSLITFDDIDAFRAMNPPITVIAQPAYEIGVAAADLLLRQLGEMPDEQIPSEVILPTRLIVRGSTAAPRLSRQTGGQTRRPPA